MEILEAIEANPIAAMLRQSSIAYPLLNAAHIASFALLFGAIATLDLRILGLISTQPISTLAGPLSTMAAFGLALAIATGALLFSVRPQAYAENPAFLVKLALVAAGLVNALALRAQPSWKQTLSGASASTGTKLASGISLLLWIGAILAGRWIGFLE